MKFVKILICLAVIPFSNVAFAQNNKEEQSIKESINKLFEGMRKSDTTLMRQAFAPNSIMQTTVVSTAGFATAKQTEVESFIKSFAVPRKDIYDERIVFTKILIDHHLASVWTDYQFYIGKQFSHCGVNSFQMIKTQNGWKINYVIDTRRKDQCN